MALIRSGSVLVLPVNYGQNFDFHDSQLETESSHAEPPLQTPPLAVAGGDYRPVSYTHLDVYKRQGLADAGIDISRYPKRQRPFQIGRLQA